jgi:hypothetical protein
MSDEASPGSKAYPLGRGYGHDYMRGGEVMGGYGYSEREEYALTRGTLTSEVAQGSESARMGTEQRPGR